MFEASLTVLLTKAGAELAPICGSAPSKDFFHYVVKRWYDQGLILSSRLQKPEAFLQ